MKVSVVVSVYNIANYITYCVESLINQNCNDFDIILVDDGSTDNSSLLCDNLAAQYDKIKVVHKQNGGLSSARNAGLDIATGDYVLFIDGDDYLQNGAIKKLLEVAEKTNADVVQYGYEEVLNYDGFEDAKKKILDYDGDFIVETNRHKFYDNLYILGGVAASACTKLMRLDLVKSIRFKEEILHEDEQFTTHLLAVCNTIVYINDFLPYKYVFRNGSIVNSEFKSKKLYDLSFIYEERIAILKQFNYEDLVNKTAGKYFCELVLLYGQALKVHDLHAKIFIDIKLKYILKNYDLFLSGYNRLVQFLYLLGLPGVYILYILRKFLVNK